MAVAGLAGLGYDVIIAQATRRPVASGTVSLVVAGRSRGPLRYSTGDRLAWSGARDPS